MRVHAFARVNGPPRLYLCCKRVGESVSVCVRLSSFCACVQLLVFPVQATKSTVSIPAILYAVAALVVVGCVISLILLRRRAQPVMAALKAAAEEVGGFGWVRECVQTGFACALCVRVCLLKSRPPLARVFSLLVAQYPLFFRSLWVR